MMKNIVFSIGFFVLPLTAAPKDPETRQLDSERIETIRIHSDINTLLFFPSRVDLIVGAGLTDGSIEGFVQYQQFKDAKIVLLRQLKEMENILIHITCEDRIYPFRLEHGNEPSSVIKFEDGPVKAKILRAEEVSLILKKPSKTRQLELMRLATESDSLAKKIPEQYEGFEAKNVGFKHEAIGLQTTVRKVAKFEKERSVVLLGEIENFSSRKANFSKFRAQIFVGFSNQVAVQQLRVLKPLLAPGEKTSFQAIIVAGASDELANVSIENPFRLSFRSE